MKKEVLSFVIALGLFAIASIGIISCSKSDHSTEEKQLSQLKEFFPAQKNIVPLINAFNSKYVEYNQGYKSGEDIPLDEALWNLEAGVNYAFRSPKDSLRIISYTSTSITLGLTETETGDLIVNNEDLFSNYTDILLFNEDAISNSGPSSKLVYADLAIESINENEAELVMTAAVGQPKPRKCFIQSDDYWYAANELGYCTGGQAQTGILDASFRIDQLIENRHCSYPTCPGGGEVTSYTSIEEIDIDWNYQTGNWYFWYGENPNECLDPDDVEYWWLYAESVIESKRPTGKSFIDVSYYSAYSGTLDVWAHIISPARFGIPDCSGSGGGM